MPPMLDIEREYDIDEFAEIVAEQEPFEPVRILDIFCGAGGVGWALKDLFTAPGVDGTFTGVDIEDHSETYPGEFVQMNVNDLSLDALGLSEPVDLVWLSPPCQAYSKLSQIWHENPKEVHPTFDELEVHRLAEELGKEYVIENVVGCDDLRNPVKLNGPAFNQRFLYERWFETSFEVNSWREDSVGGELRFCDVSENKQARAKGVPEHWSKQAIRSALPGVYIGYLLSHCPTLTDITPSGAQEEYLRCGAGDGQTWLSAFGNSTPSRAEPSSPK